MACPLHTSAKDLPVLNVMWSKIKSRRLFEFVSCLVQDSGLRIESLEILNPYNLDSVYGPGDQVTH